MKLWIGTRFKYLQKQLSDKLQNRLDLAGGKIDKKAT